VANGGASIEAPPGPRETASMGTIELAYFRDPDANKLCGIHFPQLIVPITYRLLSAARTWLA
jgi:hypothetical protein